MPESEQQEKPLTREELERILKEQDEKTKQQINEAMKTLTSAVAAHDKKIDEEIGGIRREPLKTLCSGIEDIAKSAIDKIARRKIEETAGPVVQKIIDEKMSGEKNMLAQLAHPLIRYRNTTLIASSVAALAALVVAMLIGHNFNVFNKQIKEAQKLDAYQIRTELTSHIESGSQQINLLEGKLIKYSDSKSAQLEQKLESSSASRENDLKKNLEAQISGLKTDSASYLLRIEALEKVRDFMGEEQKKIRENLENIGKRYDEINLQLVNIKKLYEVNVKKEELDNAVAGLKTKIDALNGDLRKYGETAKASDKNYQEMQARIKELSKAISELTLFERKN